MPSPIAPSWSGPPTATAFSRTLFAPAEHRGALHALYAFNVEVARVREVAREPLPGEIRLQWWSDVLRGERGGEASANPVAAALLTVIERYRLAAPALTALIDARRFDLYDDPMATARRSRSLCGKTSSALFALAAQILGVEAEATEPVATPPASPMRSPASCAPSRCMPRAGSSTCRSNCSSAMASSRRTYSPADPRRILRAAFAELRGHRPRATFVAAHATDQRRCPTPHCRLSCRSRWCGRRSTAWSASDPFAPAELPPWRRQWLIWRAARNPARIAG